MARTCKIYITIKLKHSACALCSKYPDAHAAAHARVWMCDADVGVGVGVGLFFESLVFEKALGENTFRCGDYKHHGINPGSRNVAGLVCARWLGYSVVPQVGPWCWCECRWPNGPI